MKDFWKDANKVKVKVANVKGVCTAGCKEGNEWILQKYTPDNFCGITYTLLYPSIRTLVFGGEIPFAKDGVLKVSCPDPKNTVTFHLSAIKKGDKEY